MRQKHNEKEERNNKRDDVVFFRLIFLYFIILFIFHPCDNGLFLKKSDEPCLLVVFLGENWKFSKFPFSFFVPIQWNTEQVERKKNFKWNNEYFDNQTTPLENILSYLKKKTWCWLIVPQNIAHYSPNFEKSIFFFVNSRD